MKRLLFSIIAFSALLASSAMAQTVNEAVAIGCGGGFSTSGNYAGNCTIGLPFVGLLHDASNDTNRIGLYDLGYGVTHIRSDSSAISFDTLYGEYAKFISNPAFGYRQCRVVANDSGAGVTVHCVISGTDFSFDGASQDTDFSTDAGYAQVLDVEFLSSASGFYIGTLTLSATYDTLIIPLSAYASVDDEGVQSLEGMPQPTIYPNPATGSFTIDAANLGNHIIASLYNERGAFVLDATPFMTRENDNLQFTLHGLASGSYMLTLDDGKERYSYKLSIRN